MKRQYSTLDVEHGAAAGMLLVPVGGFEWRTGLSRVENLDAGRTTDPDRWLVALSGEARGYPVFRRYNLLYDFEHLAHQVTECLGVRPRAPDALDRVAAATLEFANRYGHLDHPSAVVRAGTSATVEHGEPLTYWVRELVEFGELRELAAALARDSAADRAMLRSLIAWSGTGVTFRRRSGPRRRFAVIASTKIYPTAWSQIPRGDWRVAMDYFVCREVNARLVGQVSPTVLPFAQHRLRFFAATLRSSIYYEFARELAGKGRDVREVECANPVCEQVFRPGRRDRRFCSNACRSLAGYHRRRATA